MVLRRRRLRGGWAAALHSLSAACALSEHSRFCAGATVPPVRWRAGSWGPEGVHRAKGVQGQARLRAPRPEARSVRDAKLRNADEVEQEAAEWQQKAERVHNERYNQRERRPQEFGV